MPPPLTYFITPQGNFANNAAQQPAFIAPYTPSHFDSGFRRHGLVHSIVVTFGSGAADAIHCPTPSYAYTIRFCLARTGTVTPSDGSLIIGVWPGLFPQPDLSTVPPAAFVTYPLDSLPLTTITSAPCDDPFGSSTDPRWDAFPRTEFTFATPLYIPVPAHYYLVLYTAPLGPYAGLAWKMEDGAFWTTFNSLSGVTTDAFSASWMECAQGNLGIGGGPTVEWGMSITTPAPPVTQHSSVQWVG